MLLPYWLTMVSVISILKQNDLVKSLGNCPQSYEDKVHHDKTPRVARPIIYMRSFSWKHLQGRDICRTKPSDAGRPWVYDINSDFRGI